MRLLPAALLILAGFALPAGAQPGPARTAAPALSLTPPPAPTAAPSPAPAPAAAAAAGMPLIVLNSGDANIQVFDSRTREETRKVNVLREVHHLVPTPDGKTILVGDSGGNEMLYLDPATGEIRKRERLSNPYNLGFSPDGKKLVVTSLRRDQVDIYDWANDTLTLAARLKLPDMPSHLAYRPDGRVVYVTLQGNRGLAAIDLEKNEPLWTMDVGPEPAGVIWHNGRLLVGIMGADHVAVVNPDTRLIERTIAVGKGAHALFTGPVNEVGQAGPIYVTSRVESRITVLDPRSLDVVQQWNIPGGPDCITFDLEGRLWMTLRWVGRVAVLDPETGNVEQFRVGRSPHGIMLRLPPRA